MRRTLSLWASIAYSLVLLGAGFEPSPLTAQPKQDSGTGIQFSEHLIMEGYTYPHGIAAQDLDGDGDLDLTSADAGGHDKLYWFENDGRGSFKRHLIQEKDPERLERHRIGDIDGDGVWSWPWGHGEPCISGTRSSPAVKTDPSSPTPTITMSSGTKTTGCTSTAGPGT